MDNGRLWSPYRPRRVLGLLSGGPSLGLPLRGQRRRSKLHHGLPRRKDSYTLSLSGHPPRGRSVGLIGTLWSPLLMLSRARARINLAVSASRAIVIYAACSQQARSP